MFKKNSITQGDSLELLKKIPDKSIDLVFADPPYNLQLKDTLYRPDQTTVEAVTNDWDKFDTYQAYDEFCLVWLKECKRVLKDDGSLWIIGSYQSNFSIPLSINIATYIRAPAVAYGGTIAANGEKKIATKNKAPTNTAVRPVLPPASTPAELST